MPILIDPIPRRRRHAAMTPTPTPTPTRRPTPTPTPTPTALELVAVEYSPGNWVRLTFDRAIDIAALAAAELLVADANLGATYQGGGPGSLASDETVEVAVSFLEMGAGGAVVMTVGAANGIVAANDGAAWGGTSGVAIPFP